MKGSYTLLIELGESKEIEVGSLGELELSKGFYAYNGSALGPGGLKRVDRHRKKAEEGGSCHWHIDYLLIEPESKIVSVLKSSSDHECSLSMKMTDKFNLVDSFGCSDCDCVSHLFHSQNKNKLSDFLSESYS